MTPHRAAYGASLRQARAQRVRMIRRRVIAGALALFVATWLFITLVLVTGHDPALASQRAVAATTTQTPAKTSSGSSGASGGSGGSTATTSTSSTPSTTSAGTSTTSSGGTTAVTSSQS